MKPIEVLPPEISGLVSRVFDGAGGMRSMGIDYSKAKVYVSYDLLVKIAIYVAKNQSRYIEMDNRVPSEDPVHRIMGIPLDMDEKLHGQEAVMRWEVVL